MPSESAASRPGLVEASYILRPQLPTVTAPPLTTPLPVISTRLPTALAISTSALTTVLVMIAVPPLRGFTAAPEWMSAECFKTRAWA
jgi:hypothetical protein